MPDPSIPSEAPPSYTDATAGSSSRPQQSSHHAASRLEVPGQGSRQESSGSIPSQHRRSMEDEMRALPKGWVRTFDPETDHHFYVDTTKDPPRSVWVHPYDDDEYLSTLSSAERERIESESLGRGHPPSKADIISAHTDDEDEESPTSSSPSSHRPGELPPRPEKGKGKDGRSFGRKFKDKLTGSTHEERESERKQRAERERQLYEQHLRFRRAMSKAAQTGQRQLVGKDKNGKEIYVEPPSYGLGQGGGLGGGYGYSPYSSGGMYSNSRYARPAGPYYRPAGYGYGGGYGLPLGMMGGGLMGGLLLGDMMGGGMGMGMGGGGMGM